MKEHWQKYRKIYITIIIIIVVIILIKIIVNLTKKSASNTKPTTQITASGGNSSSGSSWQVSVNPALNYNQILQVGSQGAEVTELQSLINEYFDIPNISVDGVFGNQTKTAVNAILGKNSCTLNEVIAVIQNYLGEQLEAGIEAFEF